MSSAPKAREVAVEVFAAVLLVAVTVAMLVLAPPQGTPDLVLVAAMIVLYAAFWQVTFEIGSGTTMPLQVVFVPMWFIVEPALLPIVVGAGQVLGNVLTSLLARERHHWRRVFIGLPDAGYSVGPALVLLAFGVTSPSLDDWAILLLAIAAQFAADGVFGLGRTLAAIGGRASDQFRIVLWIWMVDLALAPIGLLTAIAMLISPWAIVTVIPFAGLLSQFAKERDDRILKALELSSAYRGTAQLMGDVLEADDAYTGGEHTQGVVELSLAVGRALDLSPAQMRDLEFGALLHDIGKLRVPNEIINKPGKLTDEEWGVIKQHPAWGQEMLDRVGGALSEAGSIVRAHHERWDGRGYPDGLVGETIPVEARIITVCDSFSAMTTDRSYRRGMARDEAVAELDRCSGEQFDPRVVDVMKVVLAGIPAPHFGLARAVPEAMPDPGAAPASSVAPAEASASAPAAVRAA